MKIGIILGSYYKNGMGGSEIQVKYLIDHFIEKGHDVFYISHGEKNEFIPKIVDNNMRLYTIKRPFKRQLFLIIFNKKILFSILNKERPDILYQRGDFDYWDLISKYGKMKQIPVVSGVSCDHFSKKLKVKLFNVFLFKDIFYERMKKSYYKNSDLIICQTTIQQNNIKKDYGLDSIVIPNGHPIPKGPFFKEKNPTILWVSNIKPLKRLEIFLNISKKLNNNNNNNFKFIIIGKQGNKKYQNVLEKKMKEINNLQYYGELSMEKTNEIIAKSWIIVNTSEYEGFANTFIQSWLREVIVISMNHDPDNLIKKFKFGYLCLTEKEVIKKIKYLLNNFDKTLLIRKEARNYAIKNFNIEKISNNHIIEFEKIIKKL